MVFKARTLEEIIKGMGIDKRWKKVHGLSLSGGPSKGDKEGATREVGGGQERVEVIMLPRGKEGDS